MQPLTNADYLEQRLEKLPPSDREFARSLINAHRQYRGNLSPKRQFHFDKFLKLVDNPNPLADKSVKVNVGSFDGVIGLFRKAQEHLKFPKIRLQLEDGSPIVLSVAGPNSRAPGTVNITDGGSFGSNTWYGRVEPNGNWSPSRDVDARRMDDLGELLEALSKKPAETAAHYGRLTGRCCFCHLKLSDDRSTAMGYGETCADHYGLPWGEKRHTFVKAGQQEMTL